MTSFDLLFLLLGILAGLLIYFVSYSKKLERIIKARQTQLEANELVLHRQSQLLDQKQSEISRLKLENTELRIRLPH